MINLTSPKTTSKKENNKNNSEYLWGKSDSLPVDTVKLGNCDQQGLEDLFFSLFFYFSLVMHYDQVFESLSDFVVAGCAEEHGIRGNLWLTGFNWCVKACGKLHDRHVSQWYTTWYEWQRDSCVTRVSFRLVLTYYIIKTGKEIHSQFLVSDLLRHYHQAAVFYCHFTEKNKCMFFCVVQTVFQVCERKRQGCDVMDMVLWKCICPLCIFFCLSLNYERSRCKM